VEAILDRSNAGRRVVELLSWGGDRKGEQAKADQASRRRMKYGETSEYLEARLRRSLPEIAAAYDRGKFTSLKAAARNTGIVRDPTPFDVMRRAWKRASNAERSRFIDVIKGWLRKHPARGED
jgi:hypothetical protein